MGINLKKERQRRDVDNSEVGEIVYRNRAYQPATATTKEVDHYFANIHLSDAIGMLENKRCAIQAGGCLGLWPLELSTHFQEVWTFEPDRTLYECLKKNVQRPNVIPTDAALGKKPGGGNMTTRGIMTGRIDQIDSIIGDTPITTIDSMFTDRDLSIDFIQLDVEGRELDALKGGENIIKRYKPLLQIEVRGLGEKFGSDDDELFQWLAIRGYSPIKKLPRSDVIFMHGSNIS